MPTVWTVVAITGTFVLTCLLPITAIWIMVRRGKVSSMQIADASERTMPYVYSSMGFLFWTYLLTAILHVPFYIGMVAVGGTVAIGIVAFINQRWKISAHLTGFGGLFGGFISYCIGIGAMPTWSGLSVWLALSLLLMYARLRLNAHTSTQVVAGFLLGLSCTFLPYCILNYVL